MYGDFSRFTFNESDDYAAVWSQQGRVTLDSDLNELTSIVMRRLRELTVDTLGPFASGYPGNAFKVSRDPSNPNDLLLEPGRYYVHGMRCHLRPTENALERSLRTLAGRRAPAQLPDRPYLVELVVWEQTVTAVTEPSLLEPALGATDTTVRTVVRFRPEITDVVGEYDVSGFEDRDTIEAIFVERNERRHANTGTLPRLLARSRTDDEAADPGERTRYRAGYRGLENQLYRVQVRTGGPLGEASFAWSRDNGSAMFGLRTVTRGQGSGEVTAELAAPTSNRLGQLEIGDWVELGDETSSELLEPSPLLQVTDFDQGIGVVTLAAPRAFNPADVGGHPYLRRWDQTSDTSRADNAIPIPAPEPLIGSGKWFELEDGVQVQFVNADSAEFRSGDHWLIPARSAIADILWPRDWRGAPRPVPATRPRLYRAPLALVRSRDEDPVDLRGRPGHPAAAPEPSEPGEDDEAPGRTRQQKFARAAPEEPSPVVVLTVLAKVNAKDPDHTAPVGEKISFPAGAWVVGHGEYGRAVLIDDSVSFAHARVMVEESGAMTILDGIEGRSSTSGTFVEHNGKIVKATTPTPAEMDDIIYLGGVPLRVGPP